MNPVDLLLRAEAAQSGGVRARRLVRHVHVEKAPLAIIALQMAGEPHGVWAALVGTNPDPASARFILAPEPRSYDIEFAALTELGTIICDAVDRSAKAPRDDIPRKGKPPRQRCKGAPQLLVASGAAAEHLGRVARRMRPAGFGGKKVVSPFVNTGGAHLGFYAESTDHPGSSLLLVAARELSRHFVTGQSDLENAHLGTQLAWHDPRLVAEICPEAVTGISMTKLRGPEAAALIEKVPMGVLTDPDTDSETLVDLVTSFNRQRARNTEPDLVRALAKKLRFEEQLRPILLPIWRATWAAHRILLRMNEAPSVSGRWEEDLSQFTYHADYVARGGRIASVASIRRAAVQLGAREEALAGLERDEVLEDPLAMAAALAQGQAIRGKVVDVDLNHREPGKGKATRSRPLVTLTLDDDCPFPEGTDLYWSDRPSVAAEVESVAAPKVVLKITSGMQKGILPKKGGNAIFTIFSDAWVPGAPLPLTTPWTHEPAPDAPTNDSLEIDDGPPLDELVGLRSAPPLETA